MTGPRSCASCDETGCAMNRLHGILEVPEVRTSYILDDVWPETASMVASLVQPGDQLLAPGLWGPRPARYDWPGATEHRASLETALRHLAMRRVAGAQGAARQRAYLHHERRIAHALARAIDWRARHLVVAQGWLPWLDEAGTLGGRSFDVVMRRYPMAEIHNMLDAAAAEIGGSATIADFRADPALVERERTLLARARRVMSPHQGIASLFGDRAVQLAWHLPEGTARPGNRTAFLGPTIARERPDIVRRLAAGLAEPLIVFGSMIEPQHWEGMPIERRSFDPGWLDGIGTILHPAVLTHQPRRLLAVVAAGVTVYATPASGLDAGQYRPIAQFEADQSIRRRQRLDISTRS